MDYKNNSKRPSSVESLPDNEDPIREIMGRPPSWFLKWGNLLIALFLVCLFLLSIIIRYPEIIPGTATLTGTNTPKEVIANQTGKIAGLFFNNNDSVNQGQVLAFIESSADPAEVMELSATIDSSINYLNANRFTTLEVLLLKNYHQLGELQGQYQIFVSAWQHFNDYLVNGFYERKKQRLYKDINNYKNIKSRIQHQKKDLEKDKALAEETFKMNETLFREKVISAEEYRRAQSSLINKSLTIPEKDVDQLTHEAEIQSKLQDIAQVDHDIDQQQLTFRQALFKLKNDIEEWKRKYVIKAASHGTIVTPMPIQKNQYVEQGTLLAYINPADTKYYAELKLTQQSLGKVDVGMKVQLRFTAYPYEEMGYVPGVINYLSTIAVDSTIRGTVALPNNLARNVHKQLQFRNGLQARALIITKDMSILERLYYSLIKKTSLN